jgi:hypothetical protein
MRVLFLVAAAGSLCATLQVALGKITVGINLSGLEEGSKIPGRP